jgi:hypothetical protein
MEPSTTNGNELAKSEPAASVPPHTDADSADELSELSDLERHAETLAYQEEWQHRSRIIRTDYARVQRRALEKQATLAAERLSPGALVLWQDWQRYRMVPGGAMETGLDALRRLAPEAAWNDERMNAVLLKHSNLPLGSAGRMPLYRYWQVVDVAADSVEHAAYPGTASAARRYAIAMRRFARDLRNAAESTNLDDIGRTGRQARITLCLALDDGTLGVWDSAQALVDAMGLQRDGSRQPVEAVSDSAWSVIWDYVVVSMLKTVVPSRFENVPDLRTYRISPDGEFLDANRMRIRWVWDGSGSGMLESDAVESDEAARLTASAFAESGLGALLDTKNLDYDNTEEYRMYRHLTRDIELSNAAACDAIADILESRIGQLGDTPQERVAARVARAMLIKELTWSNVTDEQFERLLFNLVSVTPGYENAEWLTKTHAPDRGRDISVWRVSRDPLVGTCRYRMIIACKHWLSRSVGPAEVGLLREQMKLWHSPRIDVLVIATSGAFTTDAIDLIEKHNQSDFALRIEKWPGTHLEHILADRPELVREFGLRPGDQRS